MIYITGTRDIHLENTAVALGKFDGLHRGHQILIEKIKQYKADGLQAVMFTFDFHPASLLTKLSGIDQASMFRYYASHPSDTNNFPPSAEWMPGMLHKYGIGPELAETDLPEKLE